MNFADMTLPQLAKAYNEMVRSPTGPQFVDREVTKFRDKPTAIARCEALANSIRTWAQARTRRPTSEANNGEGVARSGGLVSFWHDDNGWWFGNEEAGVGPFASYYEAIDHYQVE
jgi:hypothetical protein